MDSADSQESDVTNSDDGPSIREKVENFKVDFNLVGNFIGNMDTTKDDDKFVLGELQLAELADEWGQLPEVVR